MKSFFSHYLPVQLEWLNSLGKRPELCGVNRDVMNKTARVAGVNFTLHNRTAIPGHKKALIKRAFYRH
jgi:hypothetical protein